MLLGEHGEYANQQLESYRNPPEFVAAGEPFDAKACMAGKKILGIPVSSANPFTKNIYTAMKQVADKVGFTFTEWENQGQPSQWVQGMNHAINQGYDLIDLVGGTDPEGAGAPGQAGDGCRHHGRRVALQRLRAAAARGHHR